MCSYDNRASCLAEISDDLDLDEISPRRGMKNSHINTPVEWDGLFIHACAVQS